jgi:hypothetical protein
MFDRLINEILWSDWVIELRRDPVIKGNHLEINRRIAKLQGREVSNV